MERIQSLLKKLGIENLVDDKLMKEFKINKFKKHSLVLGSGDSSEKVMVILQGEVKVHVYSDEGGVFYGMLKKGEFFGLISTILNRPVLPDFITTKDSEILIFPLKKIMTTRKDIMNLIWDKIAIKTAEESVSIISKTLSRATSSNELFFIKYIEKNKGELSYSSTSELSENLNINIRTLQRIIKKLSEKEIIEKSKGLIRIKKYDLFKKHKQSLLG
ncbi:Crp/Fnr family transcriptional regulator [Ilyobacter polytropus]|uniref:Transcriptional regulator, Crp/Fnr family n=1 Tax=Ilyobacter polytropus (strain ATCC 51220 / DSM 2926 / LMG 16218 / CuHBu1) TaxID=572544 RepID=E3HAF5_ILYPC|nr:Crp/Fnr family transcriptional regulator [Ilyobacter polytropus]ADO82029.1 putative transcriptional regulator, Crp/Fnr family [Ilyobacter polytropus DSM 2926]